MMRLRGLGGEIFEETELAGDMGKGRGRILILKIPQG